MTPLPVSFSGVPDRANSNISTGSTVTAARPLTEDQPLQTQQPDETEELATAEPHVDTGEPSSTSVSPSIILPNNTPTLTINTGETINTSSALKFQSFGNSEGRDVSESSRDSLRRHLEHRKMSLTAQEHSFLDRLVIQGNEVEVQLAFERLQDEDLFFDYQTPRHLKYHGPLGCNFEDKDETEDGQNTSEHRDEPSVQSFNELGDLGGRPSLTRSSSQGSQRRLAVLEQRRNSTHHARLWKAHQSGLAVTSAGSKMSLLFRTTSIESLSTSAGSLRRSPSDIFRPNSKNLEGLKRNSSTNSLQNIFSGPAGRQFPPPLPRGGRPNKRSNSFVGPSVPAIPPPTGIGRRSSTSSRKSVTFHQETDGIPKLRPKTRQPLLRRSVSDTSFLNLKEEPPQGVGISKEDKPSLKTLQVTELPEGHPPLLEHFDSTTSFPSLHHGQPIRQESISSIPSLHHGHLIREESISSIPSLHHGHPIRQESISSIPSLHHGRPIRQESISSVPSLHHGHLLEEQSVSSNLAGAAERDMAAQDAKALLLQKYAATSDVATKWLEQQGGEASKESSSTTVIQPLATSTTTDTTTAISVLTSDTPSNERPSTQVFSPKTTVLMRMASRNDGEGVEVSEFFDRVHGAEGIPSLVCMDSSIRTCNSFDTSLRSYRHPEIFRSVQRSLSEEDMAHLFLGPTATSLFRETSSYSRPVSEIRGIGELDDDEDDASWDMNSDNGRFDSWNVLKDEYANGYGGGGTLGFLILGTDADDEAAQPHVLSPPLMESLQAFMPFSLSGQNFFLKYSMVRDGASLPAFLKRARGVQYSILALETVDGEVFGCFTAQPWRKNWNYFGTGESFLWRMRRSRLEKTHCILEQAHLESEIDVFPYTGENRLIQLCTHDRIAVGGGTPSEKKSGDDYTVGPSPVQPHEWGFGLAISSDFLSGTSSPCVTFGSPSLSHVHSDGTVFEIVNLELWTTTPCFTVEDAEKLELGKLFLERN